MIMIIKRLLVSTLWLVSVVTPFYPAADESCAMDCCASEEVSCETESQATCPAMTASNPSQHMAFTPAPGGADPVHGFFTTLQVALVLTQTLDRPPSVALDHPVHIPAPHFSLLI